MAVKLIPLFERRRQKLAPFSVFLQRLAGAVAAAACIVAVVLFIGISGYHWLAGFDWIDSLLEASMILGGMGPVNPVRTTSAKLFASGYALFSGLVFIAIMGIVLTPVVHRILHKFHVE
jgi:small ligand-binding sensory domain FIST